MLIIYAMVEITTTKNIKIVEVENFDRAVSEYLNNNTIDEGKIVMKARISNTLTGKALLQIEVIMATDKLTENIFVREEWLDDNETYYFLRNLDDYNNYEEVEDEDDVSRIATQRYEEEFNTFEKAEKKLIEILEKIKEMRDKVREKLKKSKNLVIIL